MDGVLALMGVEEVHSRRPVRASWIGGLVDNYLIKRAAGLDYEIHKAVLYGAERSGLIAHGIHLSAAERIEGFRTLS